MKYYILKQDFLMHHGVKGMKWGVRRYQNYDGTRIGVSKAQHYNRNKYNTDVPKTAADAKAQGWNSSVPANAHQRNTKPGKRNVKYVSPDGHREGIYNHKGDLVGGSYNYSSPIHNPMGHLINDVVPYIKYGSKPGDKTTPLKRTEELLGLHGAEKVREDIAEIGRKYTERLAADVKVNPGLSMPKPTMYSEKYNPENPQTGARHTGKNPRRQSITNVIRGTLSGHYLRNKLNKNLPQNDADAERRGWRKLSDKDSSMHQFHTEDGVKNSKWVSPDGHREVVFTGKGANQHISTDPRDQGTYNFFDPKKHPIGHATLDVVPYLLLGNSSDDGTSMYDRAFESIKNFTEKKVNDFDTVVVADGEKRVKKMLG